MYKMVKLCCSRYNTLWHQY